MEFKTKPQLEQLSLEQLQAYQQELSTWLNENQIGQKCADVCYYLGIEDAKKHGCLHSFSIPKQRLKAEYDTWNNTVYVYYQDQLVLTGTGYGTHIVNFVPGVWLTDLMLPFHTQAEKIKRRLQTQETTRKRLINSLAFAV